MWSWILLQSDGTFRKDDYELCWSYFKVAPSESLRDKNREEDDEKQQEEDPPESESNRSYAFIDLTLESDSEDDTQSVGGMSLSSDNNDMPSFIKEEQSE